MTTTASRVERDLDEIRRLAAEGAALVGEEGTGAGPDAYEQRVETARKAEERAPFSAAPAHARQAALAFEPAQAVAARVSLPARACR